MRYFINPESIRDNPSFAGRKDLFHKEDPVTEYNHTNYFLYPKIPFCPCYKFLISTNDNVQHKWGVFLPPAKTWLGKAEKILY